MGEGFEQRNLFAVAEQLAARARSSNDDTTCQAITELVRRVPGRFGGVLQPAAAIHGQHMLVVFQERLGVHIDLLAEPIMTPPIRLFGLFELIIDTLPAGLRGPLRTLAATIQRELGF